MVKAKATTSKERDARLDRERLVRESEEARAELAATDWRVIRAMEQWMAVHEGLPAGFVAERNAMRERASEVNDERLRTAR